MTPTLTSWGEVTFVLIFDPATLPKAIWPPLPRLKFSTAVRRYETVLFLWLGLAVKQIWLVPPESPPTLLTIPLPFPTLIQAGAKLRLTLTLSPDPGKLSTRLI